MKTWSRISGFDVGMRHFAGAFGVIKASRTEFNTGIGLTTERG
jgi:hypothetical protein